MDFDIGSNQYRNALNSIEIDGLGQFSFEFTRRYNEMMLRGALFDSKGELTAKIAESSLLLNIRGEFEVLTEPSVVKVIRRGNEEVVLEVKFLDKDHVQINKARLFTSKGHPFEVTPTFWKLGESSHSGEFRDCAGGPVQLS
jgi:hypothetical protein